MFRKYVYLLILATALALGYGWAADTALAHSFQIGGDVQYRPTDQQIDASLADTLWPRQGYNNRNTSRSPYLSPYSPILEKKVSVPGFRPNRPIAGEDSRLYYEDSYNKLHATEADGAPLWSIQLEGYANGGLALAPDGTLYTLRSYPAVLYAIHPDGSIKWRYDIPSGNPGSFTPLLNKNGAIYVRSGGTIYAIHSDGTLKWTRAFREVVNYALTADGNLIVHADYRLHCLTPYNTITWISEQVPANHGIVINDDGSILSLGSNWLTKFSADGFKLWSKGNLFDGFTYGSMYMATAADGTIFILHSDPYSAGYVAALDADGNRKWITRGIASVCNNITVTQDNVLYISSGTNRTFAIHSSGALLWTYDVKLTYGYNSATQIIPGPNRTLRFISSEEPALYMLRESPLSGLNARQALAKRNTDNMSGLSFISDPVDASSGAQMMTHEFLTNASPNPLSLKLSYHSLLLSPSSLGNGWDHNYDIALKENYLGNKIVYWSANRCNTYSSGDGQVYHSIDPDALSDQLVKNTDNTFTLTRSDQTAYHFNAGGQLLEITDPHGRSQSLAYDSSNRLATVQDMITESRILFTYNAKNQMIQADGELGQSVRLQYDSKGNLSAITDENGQTTRYISQPNGQIMQSIDPEGTTLFTNTYDTSGRITKQTDGLGYNTTIEYEEETEPGTITTTYIDRNGVQKRLSHDTKYRLTGITYPDGLTTQYGYDEAGNRIRETDALGRTTLMTYDKRGNLLTRTNPAGETTVMTYDERNNLLTVTNPAGHTLSYTYDSHNNLIQSKDPEGHVTVWIYDENSLPVAKTAADGSVTTYRYDHGLLTTVTDPEGCVTAYEYDRSGRLVRSMDPLGGTTAYMYDGQDHVLESIDPLGHKTEFTYNSHGDMLTKTDAMGNITFYTYNKNGKRLTSTDPMGQVTRYEYDGEDRLLKVIDPMGYAMEQIYDSKGRLIQTVNALGHATTREYDPADQLLRQIDPLGYASSFEYDSAGRITAKTDRLGHIFTSRYDSAGRLTSAVNPLSEATDYTYDANGNLLSETNPDGASVSFVYDAAGRIQSETNALGETSSYTYNRNGLRTSVTHDVYGTTRYAYDANSRLIRETDALGQVTAYDYDAKGRLTQTIQPGGGVIRMEYDPLDRLVSRTDAEGYTETYAYNPMGNLVKKTDAAGSITSMSYDANGRLLTVTDPLGYLTAYTYDPMGNLLTEADANGNLTRYEYDGNGQRTAALDSMGNRTEYKYDGEGRLLTVQDPLGYLTTRQYDALGRQTSMTDPMGHTCTQAYDSSGNIVKWTDGMGNQAAAAYDLMHRQTEQTDALGRTTRFAYNGLGQQTDEWDPAGHHVQRHYDLLQRLISVNDPLGQQTGQTYHAQGTIHTITDPNGSIMTYTYDKNGRVLSETNASGSRIGYNYNPKGLLLEKTNARGQISHYTYDNAGRLDSWTDPDGTVNYGYDPNGNILRITESVYSAQTEKTRTYDALGRVTSYTDGFGNTIGYQYDAAGQLVLLTYPDGKTVRYRYDKAGNMTGVTDWAGRTTLYVYDENYRLIRTSRPDGSEETLQYDAAGQLLALTDMTANGAILEAYTYSYDLSGNVLKEQDLRQVHQYRYDHNGRLLQAGAASYAYDPAGNLTVAEAVYGSLVMTYGPDNRLAAVNGIKVYHDQDGNLTDGAVSGDLSRMVYDSRNRLIEAGDVRYTYDAENIRTSVTEAVYETRFVVNPHTSISQLLMETDSSGQVQAYYVYGMGLVGREAADGSYAVYHYDRRGSTTVLTDVYGTVTDRYEYGSYGEVLVKEGTTPNPFLYNGRDGVMTDANGLYYMRARYYSPLLKRFVNRDVAAGSITEGQTLNRYAFVNGNPISYVDPFGLSRDSDSKQHAKNWFYQSSFGKTIFDNIIEPYGNAMETFTNHTAPGRFLNLMSQSGAEMNGGYTGTFSSTGNQTADTIAISIGVINGIMIGPSHGLQSGGVGISNIPKLQPVIQKVQSSKAYGVLDNEYGKVPNVFGKGTGEVANIPKLVYKRVNVRNGDANVKGSGLNYALGKHGGVDRPNKSQFSISRDELKELLQLKQVVNSPVTVSPTSGDFVRQIDVGHTIGNLPVNRGGTPTSTITVITDKKGNLVNAFPGGLGFGEW